MKEANEVLKKYNIKPLTYKKLGNVLIVTTNDKKYVLKKIINKDIYNYLSSRSFDYYPKYIIDDLIIMDYIEDESNVDDEKMLDLIKLISLLHSKTTFYSNVSIDDIKKEYEDLKDRINKLFIHYENLISIIENKEFMSPSELLFARNYSLFLNSLNYSNFMLDEWYKEIKDNTRRRYALIHNNLNLSHFIKNKKPYLISWDKAKRDIPIYDLYNLYKKYGTKFDFKSLISTYKLEYPLLDEEEKIFNVLITIPDEFNFSNCIYDDCVILTNIIDYLSYTEKYLSPDKLKN